MFHSIARLFAHVVENLIHLIIYRGHVGQITLVGVDEPGPVDGHVVIMERRHSPDRVYGSSHDVPVTYGFHFENRKMAHMKIGYQTMAVWNHVVTCTEGARPVAVLISSKAYTPLGPVGRFTNSIMKAIPASVQPIFA